VRRAITLSFALALSSTSIAGCADDATSADARGIPAEEDTLRPPGTRLDERFTVADGTLLVGAVFPGTSVTEEFTGGWRALLLVTGDPLTVLDAYRRQAAKAGMDMRPGTSNTTFCRLAAPVRPYMCEAHATGEHDELLLTLHRGMTEDHDSVSHVWLEYTETIEPPVEPLPTTARPREPQPPPLPDRWRPLPRRRGEKFGTPYPPTR
jgi:hypothetical protein